MKRITKVKRIKKMKRIRKVKRITNVKRIKKMKRIRKIKRHRLTVLGPIGSSVPREWEEVEWMEVLEYFIPL